MHQEYQKEALGLLEMLAHRGAANEHLLVQLEDLCRW